MKSLKVTAGRCMVLFLCIMIIGAFCFPLNASAETGGGDPAQDAWIADSEGGSTLPVESTSNEKLYDGPEGDSPLDAAEIKGFAFDKTEYGRVLFTIDSSSLEGLNIDSYNLIWKHNGEEEANSFIEVTGNSASLWGSWFVSEKDVLEGGGEYPITFVLEAKDAEGNVIARSNEVSATFAVSEVEKNGENRFSGLREEIIINGGNYIQKELYDYYAYSWSFNGLPISRDSKGILVGTVDSVKSSNPNVVEASTMGDDFTLNALKKGKATVTIYYTLNGKEDTKVLNMKVNDRYLQFESFQMGKINYRDVPAGTTAKYYIRAFLYKYDKNTKDYVFAGDVTDNTTFKMDGKSGYGPEGEVSTSKVSASFKGNILTVKPAKDAPMAEYYFGFKAAYSDVSTIHSVGSIIQDNLNRILVNDDMVVPAKGKTTKLDPEIVVYKGGKKTAINDAYYRVTFTDFTVTDKSGKTINTSDEVQKSQLPLTIKAASNNAFLRLEAFKPGTESYIAYIFFDNSNLLSSYDIKVKGDPKTYTGKALKPTVTMTQGGKSVSAKGYKLSYFNNKDVGTATIKIEDKNDSLKYRYVTFKINPPKTTVSGVTALKKGCTVKWKAKTAKMSKSRLTGYQVQLATNSAFTKNKKLKTAKGYKKSSLKVTGLKAKTTYYVRVRTYMKVGRTTYYSGWSKASKVKTT